MRTEEEEKLPQHSTEAMRLEWIEDSIPTPSHTQHTRFIARSCSLAPVIFIDKTGLPATEHSVIFTY